MAGNKDNINSQFGRTSDEAGSKTAGPIGSADQGMEPLLDQEGRLIVRLADGAGFIEPGIRVEFKTGGSRLAAAGEVINAAPIQLLEQVWGYNANATTLQFIHLFNSTTLPVSTTTQPDYVIPVPANFATFSLSVNLIHFDTGLVIAPSSSELTYVTPAADDFWAAINYRA
jgi:hypothetical protein